MWTLAAVLAIGAGSIVATRIIRQRNARKFGDITDDQFLALMGRRTQASAEDVMRERLYLAKAMGIPATKLHPNSRLRDIAAIYPGFTKQIAMNDLANDLYELAKDSTGRGDNLKLPQTVGELIALRLSLRS